MQPPPDQLYLGRKVDAHNTPIAEPLTYDLEHLTTHALLLGATGSGKTGLGMVLVEEVLRQGVPVLLLDVKGDLTNLLLTFPDLAPQDFAPWVDADVARRQGQTPAQAAEGVAARWQQGLAAWDLGPDDIADLRRRAEFTLYTPGSRAGQPVDILARFGAPPRNNPDEVALRAQGLASALLGLAGVDADPLRSREHILLTTLIRHGWEHVGTLDVPTLIQQVQQPPVERIGVFDLESFYPAKDRFELALTLNNLIAAPGFALWREGQPLDIASFLYTDDGRPRATVFYMAHLPEEQRHFFVTLFLEELRSWVRRQAGTRTLRAMLYFDEIYGYMPPHPYNPPPKAPLMALLKQARAAGLGVVLATQNPGDLDYKGLGNIGTWCVGALRTDRDKRRVLEGMEGAIADAGLRIPDIEAAISRLQSRVFLMHNAREGQLHFFHSRWAMAYLRGPLTTAEVQRLAGQVTATASTPSPVATPVSFGAPIAASGPVSQRPSPSASSVPRTLVTTTATPPLSQRLSVPPVVAPAIPQAFLPATITAAWARRNHQPPLSVETETILVYRPHLLGYGVTHILDDKTGVHLSDDQVWRIDPGGNRWNMRWDQGEMIDVKLDDLASTAPSKGEFEPVPSGLGAKTAQTKRESAFKTHLYRHSQITLWGCTPLKLYSTLGETKGHFLQRCQQALEKAKQTTLATARQKSERKMARLQAKIRKEELELQQDEEALSERKREELLSGAESILSLFTKRRGSRSLSRASRQRRYVQNAKAEVVESIEALQLYEEEQQQLEDAWQATAATVSQKWDAALDQVREITLRAKRIDIEVRFCGLVWFPFWEVLEGGKPVLLPAYIPQ